MRIKRKTRLSMTFQNSAYKIILMLGYLPKSMRQNLCSCLESELFLMM